LILGIGVDLVDIPRMERALTTSWSGKFLARVFSKEEISTCSGAPEPAQCFAARFAAKEALAKALGTGFSGGVAPADIRVRGGERQRPTISLEGRALSVAVAMKVGAIHVSLSHTPRAAIAMVVLEERSGSE
jgi:holo-[acyl-carrier protein] synthase